MFEGEEAGVQGVQPEKYVGDHQVDPAQTQQSEIDQIIQEEVVKGRRHPHKRPLVRSFKETQQRRAMERVVEKATPFLQEPARKEGFEEAAFDEITGLPGPAKVRQELAREFDHQAETTGNPNEAVLGVGRVDFNLVKFVNDVFDHRVGDKYIRRISEVTRSVMRSSDFLGRDGGDELTLIFCKRRPSNRSLIYAITDVDPNNEGMVVRYFRELEALGAEIRDEWRDEGGELLSERFRKLYYSNTDTELQKLANGLRSNVPEVKRERANANIEMLSALAELGWDVKKDWIYQNDDDLAQQSNDFVRKLFGSEEELSDLSKFSGKDAKIYRDMLQSRGTLPPHLKLWNAQPFASVTFAVRNFTRGEIQNASAFLKQNLPVHNEGTQKKKLDSVVLRRGLIRNSMVPFVDAMVESAKTSRIRENSFVGFDDSIQATVRFP